MEVTIVSVPTPIITGFHAAPHICLDLDERRAAVFLNPESILLPGSAAIHFDGGPRFYVLENKDRETKQTYWSLSVFTDLSHAGHLVGHTDQRDKLNEWVAAANRQIKTVTLPPFARSRRLVQHLRKHTEAPGGTYLTADTIFKMFELLIEDAERADGLGS